MTDPTAAHRTSATQPRMVAEAAVAVAVLLMSAVACTASNHVGTASKADPQAGQAAAGQQFPAGMQTMPGVANPPAGQNQAAGQRQAAGQGQAADQGQAAGKPPVALGDFAAATGCTPAAPTAGQQLKQTTCTAERGARFAVTAFASEADQQRWLKATLGGSFLVGDRWTVGADSATLQSLQQSVGGTISTS